VGKVKRLFVCSSCERPSAQWSGRCAACGDWGTVGEHPAGTAVVRARGGGSELRLMTLAPDPEEHRISTGFPHVDRVLGGGLVPGSVVLLAGAPGIGKSTLLLQLGARLIAAGHSCLLASAEEARGQVAARAQRLGVHGEALEFVPGRNLAEVVATARDRSPAVLIVDSIHTIRDTESDALPGGVGQVRACADGLIALAKETGVAVLLIGHVTKGGDLAGPRTLEHAVDCVLTFEGDQRTGRRIVVAGKNRFGPEGEVAWFEMTQAGLVEVDAGSSIGEPETEPGSSVALVLAGRRAFAVAVQALVVPTEGPPRRQVAGLDPRRFDIVAAVTERAANLRLTRSELYGASAGGLRMEDPGADLAIAAALASAATGQALPPDSAFVGEVSLTGAVRTVAGMEQRLAAAKGAGLRAVVGPAGTPVESSSWASHHLVRAPNVRDAVAWGLGDERPASPDMGADIPFDQRF
jgi:DNA repair protein RadA/Sms